MSRPRHRLRRDLDEDASRKSLDPQPTEPPAVVGRLYLVKEKPYYDRRNPQENNEGPILRAFTDGNAAEAYFKRLRREWWDCWLQTPWFDLPCITSLTPGLLRDLVMDLGLEPPDAEAALAEQGWLAWWKQAGPLMNDWQRERFLEALDRGCLYRLVTVDLAR